MGREIFEGPAQLGRTPQVPLTRWNFAEDATDVDATSEANQSMHTMKQIQKIRREIRLSLKEDRPGPKDPTDLQGLSLRD